jgi:hypothetical protein
MGSATQITKERRQSVEATATTVEGSQPFIVKRLIFVANDGTSDVILNFDGATDDEGAITLKAGEVLSDVELSCASLSYKAVSGSVPIRAWGAK